MTELDALNTGVNWLTRTSSPDAARIAVSDNASGRRAATTAPNANSSTSNVIGNDSISARLKSLPMVSSQAFAMLASPASAIVMSGYLASAAATASRIGWTRFLAS